MTQAVLTIEPFRPELLAEVAELLLDNPTVKLQLLAEEEVAYVDYIASITLDDALYSLALISEPTKQKMIVAMPADLVTTEITDDGTEIYSYDQEAVIEHVRRLSQQYQRNMAAALKERLMQSLAEHGLTNGDVAVEVMAGDDIPEIFQQLFEDDN